LPAKNIIVLFPGLCCERYLESGDSGRYKVIESEIFAIMASANWWAADAEFMAELRDGKRGVTTPHKALGISLQQMCKI